MTYKASFLLIAVVLSAACVPAAAPIESESELSMVTGTAVVTTTTPHSTATPQPTITRTPLPTKTPKTAVTILPLIPTTSPPDACPPNKPESTIPYSSIADDYRGKQFAELPVGWEEWGGYLVRDDQYGQYLIREVEREGSLMLWLEKEICWHY